MVEITMETTVEGGETVKMIDRWGSEKGKRKREVIIITTTRVFPTDHHHSPPITTIHHRLPPFTTDHHHSPPITTIDHDNHHEPPTTTAIIAVNTINQTVNSIDMKEEDADLDLVTCGMIEDIKVQVGELTFVADFMIMDLLCVGVPTSCWTSVLSHISEGSNADSEEEMEVYWINRDYEYVIGPARTYYLKRRLLKENPTQNARKAAYKKAFEVLLNTVQDLKKEIVETESMLPSGELPSPPLEKILVAMGLLRISETYSIILLALLPCKFGVKLEQTIFHIWDLSNNNLIGEQTLYDGKSFDNGPAPPPPPFTPPPHGISLGSAFFIALIALVLLLFCRKGKRNEHVPPTENSTFERGKSGSTKRVKFPITTSSYIVATLQTKTNNFSQDNIIGEGSLGRVYRADFPNAKIMAVKKIGNAALSLQEEDDFVEAVSNMSCSLQDLLHFVDDRSKTLTWNAHVRVALGTARALENLKSANILLDEELNPYLSDSGLAALMRDTEREVATQLVGSFGYNAPEFALSGIYTVKSDVYSFGVVILTGRKPLDRSGVIDGSGGLNNRSFVARVRKVNAAGGGGIYV
ncbi:protein STRUBBELIG-receptor family 8 [Tanacetum coccineum]